MLGSTQLVYVKDYLESPAARRRLVTGRYVYFGCGVGHPGMAEQEAHEGHVNNLSKAWIAGSSDRKDFRFR